MIKLFLIPICFRIVKKIKKTKPYFIGLAGGQGTGKTTMSSILSIILRKYFNLNVFKISIDDFYKTRKDRILLSKEVHPLLMTRGVPGTHDINIMLDFFRNIKKKKFRKFKLPKFNKAIDDRYKKKLWYSINKRPDVVIFEGWCVGAKAEKIQTLKKPINILEKNSDKKMKWRKYVNKQLIGKYNRLFTQLDCLLFLKAANFQLLKKWRVKQEEKLKLINNKKAKNLKIMSKKDIFRFMLTYQRITQNMFKFAPKYSSMIAKLNVNHQITKVIYNK